MKTMKTMKTMMSCSSDYLTAWHELASSRLEIPP
jgi:hypothetical protein